MVISKFLVFEDIFMKKTEYYLENIKKSPSKVYFIK